MIDRYTIKFAPAVSQKEMEKALNAPVFSTTDPDAVLKSGDQLVIEGVRASIGKMKVRIEVVGDFNDLKQIADLIKSLQH